MDGATNSEAQRYAFQTWPLYKAQPGCTRNLYSFMPVDEQWILRDRRLTLRVIFVSSGAWDAVRFPVSDPRDRIGVHPSGPCAEFNSDSAQAGKDSSIKAERLAIPWFERRKKQRLYLVCFHITLSHGIVCPTWKARGAHRSTCVTIRLEADLS